MKLNVTFQDLMFAIRTANPEELEGLLQLREELNKKISALTELEGAEPTLKEKDAYLKGTFECVKTIRELRGIGLVDAKNLMDRWIRDGLLRRNE